MEVSDQLHASAAISQEKQPQYLLDRWLGGAQNQSRCSAYKKCCLYPCQESNSSSCL